VPLGLIGVYALRGPRAPRLPRAMRAEIASWESGTPVPDAPPVIPEPGGGAPPAPLVRGPAPVTPTAIPEPAGARPAAVPEPAVTRPAPVPEVAPTRPRGITIEEPPGLEVNSPGDLSNPSQLASYLLQLERARGTARAQMLEGLPPEARAAVEAQLTNDTLLGGRNGPLSQLPAEVRAVVEPLLNDAEVMAGLRALESGRRALLPRDVIRSADRIGGMGEIHPEVLRMLEGGRQAAELQLTVDGDVIVTRPGAGRRGTYRAAGPEDAGAPRPAARRTTDTGTGEPAETTAQPPVQEPAARQEPTGWRRFLSRFSRRDRRRRRAYDEGAQAGRLAGRRGASDDPTTSDQYSMYRGDTADGTSRVDEYSRGFREGHRLGTREREVLGITDDSGLSRVEQSQVASTPEFQSLCERTGRGLGDQLRRTALQEGETLPTAEQPIPAEMGQRLVTHYQNMIEIIRALYAASMARAAEGGNALPLENIIAKLYAFPEVRAAVRAAAASPETTGVTPEMLRNLESTMTRYNLELLYRANRRVLDSVSRISPEELARLEAEDGSIPRMFTADEMGQIIEVLENGASSRGGYVPLSETVLRLLTPRDAAPAEVTPEVRLEARARLPVRERAAGDVVLNELRLVEPVEIGNRALEWDGIQTVLDNIYIEGIRSGQTEPNGVYQALVRALSDILNSRPEISAEDALRQAVRQSAVEEAVIAQYGEAYRQTRTRAGERPRRGPLTDAERAEGQRMWRQLEEAVESTDPIESLRTLIQEDSRRISLPRDRHPGQDIIDFAEAVRDSDLHIEMRGREIYVDRTNQLVQATGPEAPTIGEVRAMADWIVGFWQRWSGRAVAVGRWGLYGRFRSSIPVDRMAAHAPPEPGRIARRLPARVRAAIPQNVEQLNIFFGREGGARGWSLVGPTAVWAMMGAGLGAVVWYAMSGPGADERGREWLSGVYQREAEAMSRRYNLRITGPELEEAVEAEMRRSGLARVEISEENAELLDSDTELRAYIIEGLVIRPPTTEVRVSATVGSIETAMGQLRQRLARERPVVDPQRLDELITDARQTLARLQERREEIHRLLTRIHGEDASLRTAAEQRLRQVCQELGLDYARVSARTSMTRLTYSDVHIFRSPYWIQQNYLLTFSDFMARAFAEDTGIAERDSRGRLTERSRRDIEYLGSHPETFVFLFQGYMEGRIPRAMIPYALRRLMPARATATTPAFAGEPAHIGPRATPLTEAEISRYQETFRSRLQMDGRLHLYLPDDVLPIQGARVANNFMNQLDFQTIGNPQMRSQFIAVLRRYRGHPEQWERLINFTLPANYGIYGDRLPSREALRLWQLEPGRGFARMAEIIVSHEPEEARRLLEEAGYIAPRISHREGEGQHLYQWDSAFRWDREAVRYVFEHSSPGRDSGLAAWLAANHRAIAGNEYEIVRYLMRNVTPAVAELPPAEFQARISELVGTRETPGPLLPFWDSQVPTPLEGWTPTTERRETPMFGYTATPGRGAPIRGIEEEIQADLRSVGGEGTNTISRYMQDGESEGIRRYLENQIVTLARYYLRPGARQEIGNELVLRSILVSGTVESPIIVPIADMPNLDSVVRLIRRDESTIEQTIEQVARTLDRRIYRTEERRREIASGIVRGIAASLARIPPERRAAAIQMATRIMRRERPDRIRSFREYIHMLENQMVDSSEATIHGSVSLLIGARIAAREDLDERQREEFPGRIREIIEGNLDAWIDMPGFQRSPRRRGRGRGAVMNQVMVNPGNQAAAAEAIDREIGRLLNPEAAPAATEETTVTVNADVRGTIQTALSERRPRIAEERQTELLTQLTAMINEHAGDATWLQAAGLEVSGNEIQIASGRESAFTGWLGFEVDGLLEGE